jgi:hypothetical protein
MLSTLLLLASFNGPVLPVQVQGSEPDSSDQPSLSMHCLSRQLLTEHIRASGATPMFVGLGSNMAMEVWHDSHDLWMAFVTRPDGVSCIFARGKGMGFADPDTKPQTPPNPADPSMRDSK